MSLPKIGSVTLEVAENGTRWIHSRTVSQAPDTAPPMNSASRSASAARPQPASGVRSGMSPTSKVTAFVVWPPHLSRPGPYGERVPPRRSSAACAASLSRSTNERKPLPPSPGGGARRPAIQRLPSRAIAAIRKAPTPSPRVAPMRVQKTESNPTLLNQRASVHRSIPDAEQQEDRDDRDDDDTEPETPSGPGRPARSAVVGAARSSTSPPSPLGDRHGLGRFLVVRAAVAVLVGGLVIGVATVVEVRRSVVDAVAAIVAVVVVVVAAGRRVGGCAARRRGPRRARAPRDGGAPP